MVGSIGDGVRFCTTGSEVAPVATRVAASWDTALPGVGFKAAEDVVTDRGKARDEALGRRVK